MEQRPRLKKMHKTYNGKFLKSYRLEYEMPEGGKKYYEMVSRSELTNQQKLGSHNSLPGQGLALMFLPLAAILPGKLHHHVHVRTGKPEVF